MKSGMCDLHNKNLEVSTRSMTPESFPACNDTRLEAKIISM